jgi:hypothetical protein
VGWKIKSWETANKLLSYLEPERRHYAIFELPEGSYAQCLGSKTELTVEVRVVGANGTFTHWVLGKGLPCGRNRQVGPASGRVTVDETQVLTMRDARLIIRQFLESRTFPDKYHRQDVTGQYAEPERPGYGAQARRT